MTRTEPRQEPLGCVRSVERALDLLIALERADQPLGLSELARTTTIPKSTSRRLLSVLERRGLVQKERWGYQLGSRVVLLAGAFLTGNSLARAALPVMEELTLLSGETVSLQVRQGFDRLVIQRVQSCHSLGFVLQIGQRLPLHLGAAGRVLMAAMPTEELDLFLQQVGEMRLVNGSVRTPEDLRAKLEQTRLQGFAVSPGEREAGVMTVAAPVAKNGGGTIAVLSLTGPANRMTQEKVDRLIVEVRHAAHELTRRYPYL